MARTVFVSIGDGLVPWWPFALGHGWTYNIWGFACVKLTLGRKIIRVGTYDAEGLAKVICEKTGLSRIFD